MKRPNIRTALTMMMAGIILLIAALSGEAIYSMRVISAASQDIGNYWIERLLTAREMKGNFTLLRLAYARFAMVENDAEFATETTNLEHSKSTIVQSITKYEAGVRTADGQKLIAEIKASIEDYRMNADGYVQQIKNNQRSAAIKTFKDILKPKADLAGDKIIQLVDFIVQQANDRVAEAETSSYRAEIMTWITAAATVLAALFAIIYSRRAIAASIERTTASMRKLASGDSSSAIPFAGRSDEIGAMAQAIEVFRQNAIENKRLSEETEASRTEVERARAAEQHRNSEEAERLQFATSALGGSLKRLAAGDLGCQLTVQFDQKYESLRLDFNASVDQLSRTIRSILDTVHTIDNGTREIAAGAQDLSKRTEQQAAALEETAAALDEVTSTVSSSSKMTEEAKQVAQAATRSASASADVVTQAETAMQRIEQSSQKISNIIGVIDEIAFQTNLLALNAGVEAARAGEAGKGFAVVAQEVRELAQRSATAAKEIKGLIQNSTTEVESGVKLVRATGQSLKTISEYTIRMNQHMESIATSSREQSTGLSEINAAVNSMDQSTQQNAAMVEQSTAAASSLANESARLRKLVSEFRLGGDSSLWSATRDDRPVASPVRNVTLKVTNAFSGNTAVAIPQDNWQEF